MAQAKHDLVSTDIDNDKETTISETYALAGKHEVH